MTRSVCLAVMLMLVPVAAQAQPLPSCSAADYGAVPDDGVDDRAALQSALDACTVVNVPTGTFLVTKSPAGYYNLRLDDGKRLSGAGRTLTTLVQAPATPSSVRLLQVEGADVVIEDLTLDGDRANQLDNDEHRAGTFVKGARTKIQHVTARNFTGDGFYFYGGDASHVVDVLATGNGRDGAAYTSGIEGATIEASVFSGNEAQQLDTEHTTANDFVVYGSTFSTGGVSNDYVVTMSGLSAGRSRGWVFTGNVVNGAVFAVWLDGSVVAGNVGLNPTTKACYTVYNRSVGVSVVDNVCEMTQDTVDGVSAVYVAGSTVTEMPESVVVANNRFTVRNRAKSLGVRVQGAKSAFVSKNVVNGPGLVSAGYSGVYVRTVFPTAPLKWVVVTGNEVNDWGDSGVRVTGNLAGAALTEYFEMRNNVLGGATSQTRALVIDADAVPVRQVRVGNTCTGLTSCTGANL